MINDIKHIFNRGIKKNPIFLDDHDRRRFVESLYKFNNQDGAIRDRSSDFFQDPPEQKKLVEILQWSLLPNHFHLLLLERVDGGITEFIKRLANGYTKYFNIKYKKSGYIFQNTTKSVLLETDQQFLYIPFYIDLNPLDQAYPNWKNIPVQNPNKAIEWLCEYEWSSYYDYQNERKRNFSCLINTDKFYSLFDTNKKRYKNELVKLIKNPLKQPKN